jgi:hypothetical protein
MRNFLRVLRKRGGGTTRVQVVALAAVVAVVVGAVVLLVSWGGAAGPRPVSEDEAQRMALARFRTYEASPSEVRVRLPLGSAGSAGSSAAGTVTVRAVVDHRVHRAVGVYEAADTERTVRGLVAWDMEGIAVARKPAAPTTSGAPGGAPGRATRPPAPGVVTTAAQAVRVAATLTPEEWSRRPYTSAALDRALRLVLSMAADRPDNAQLLAQSHPLWLRDESLDGRGYGVFSGPRPRPAASPRASASPAAGATAAAGRSPLTYWIDKDGRMRRVTARLAPGQEATVDLVAERVRAKVPGTPWLRPRRP